MRKNQRLGVTDPKVQQAVRLNVRISPDAQRRLGVHCAMTGLQPGEVITRLIEGLRDWSMPVNLTAKNSQKDRPNIAGPVIESVAEPVLSDAA